MSSTKIPPLAEIRLAADHARLQHQPDRLAHRHEIALHVRMRHRQRPAALELAAEQRHHRAGAAEHVAEPHGHAAHAAAAARRHVQPCTYISASRLLAPITLLGFTALSVEMNTIAAAPAARAASATIRVPDRVGHQPFERVRLHHRHVLQRRRMEHQLRPHRLEHRARSGPRRECRPGRSAGGTLGMRLGQLGVDLPQRVFAVVEQHQAATGASAATWRASSEPIVPPAPVTSTRRPRTSRAMPSRSSGTCGRFSRSSIATGAQLHGLARRAARAAGSAPASAAPARPRRRPARSARPAARRPGPAPSPPRPRPAGPPAAAGPAPSPAWSSEPRIGPPVHAPRRRCRRPRSAARARGSSPVPPACRARAGTRRHSRPAPASSTDLRLARPPPAPARAAAGRSPAACRAPRSASAHG